MKSENSPIYIVVTHVWSKPIKPICADPKSAWWGGKGWDQRLVRCSACQRIFLSLKSIWLNLHRSKELPGYGCFINKLLPKGCLKINSDNLNVRHLARFNKTQQRQPAVQNQRRSEDSLPLYVRTLMTEKERVSKKSVDLKHLRRLSNPDRFFCILWREVLETHILEHYAYYRWNDYSVLNLVINEYDVESWARFS